MTLTVAIGFDYREAISFYVLAHSIIRRASRPVSIVPIALTNLHHIYKRPRSPMQSTDFTYSRFLTPYLAGDGAKSVFLDSDMLCLADIFDLVDNCDMYADVSCVKHDYTPCTQDKFLGAKQTAYPCKNWSSLMVFNGHRSAVRRLTPDYVNNASPMDLHQFKWADSVSSLDPAWNHLVGEYAPNPNAKLIHFTLGGPYFKGYENCEFADAWFDELRDMQHRDSPSFDLVREWR